DTVFEQKLDEITKETRIMDIREAAMTVIRQDAMRKGRKEGIEKGIEKARRAVILKMLSEGFPVDVIARINEVPLDYVVTLRNDIK
ncbi:MAG: hypothetical protein LBD45_08125, partial [Bacteroidales bacterium]|nr:hypothetical protein [Bacteroidales bacterium]